MIIDAFAVKGKIYDVCAELEAEAKRYKGITVGEWLHERRMETMLAQKLGISVDELRGNGSKK